MCKKIRTSECRLVAENIPAHGDITSDDDDESVNSNHDYMTDTSSDEGASDSEVDSAAGNRVTPDMVVWLMLKEQGFITQEKYDEKADLCEDDIRPLIPKLPRPESESSDDSEFNSEELLKTLLVDLGRMREIKNAQSSENGDSQSGSKETSNNAKESRCDEEQIISEDKTNEDEEAQENIEQLNEPANKRMKIDHENMQQTQNMEIDAMSDSIENRQQTIPSPQHVIVINDCVEEKIKQTVPKCLKCCKISFLGDENEEMNINEMEYSKIEEEASSSNPFRLEDLFKPKPESIFIPAPNKKTRSFKYILKHLVKEKRISDENEHVDVLQTYVSDLDKHYKKNKAFEIFHKPTKDLKSFALFLNFYSPSSYKYIMETFNTPLPNHEVLCTWYVKDDDKPGLSRRAFDILKQKASNKRLTCALMSRDIFIKNYGLNYDQVDYGGGCNFEYTDKAVMAFVFLLVCLDQDWKIPIGYIFAKSIPPESHAELIRVCLTQCHESGVDVVAVTLDSPTPAEFLGCSFQDVDNLKTVFKHPICDRDVAVWIDPCLAIRSARHTLKAKKVLYDDRENRIRWSVLHKLWNLYYDEDIDFEEPVFWPLRCHIAKVGLTTEILSCSLVPALRVCEDIFPGFFKETATTQRYIIIVNKLYDILNSQVITDLDDVWHDLNIARNYILALFYNRHNALSAFDKENVTDEKLQFRSFVEGKPACGYVAFLICIESFKHLHTTLVQKENILVSLDTHRLCKDHAENFVKNIRALVGLDPENLSGSQFQFYYDDLFDVLEARPGFTDKNVKQENWSLENKFSPAVTINLTSGKLAYDEVYSFQYKSRRLPTTHSDVATKYVKECSKALDRETDVISRKYIVGYVAGWIATRFAKCLKCETCIDLMCTDRRLWFHKFITSRKLEGVCRPSQQVFRICWECERAIRMKMSPGRLRAWVLQRLLHRFPWASRPARHSPQHHIHLVRAIITKYIAIRVPVPFNSKDEERVKQMFNVFTCVNENNIFDELFRICVNETADDEVEEDVDE